MEPDRKIVIKWNKFYGKWVARTTSRRRYFFIKFNDRGRVDEFYGSPK